MCEGGGDCGTCGKCGAVKKVITGALVLLNITVWPMWGVNATGVMSGLTGWIAFFAVLYIIKGVLKFVMPNCSHCKAEMPAKMSGRKGK